MKHNKMTYGLREGKIIHISDVEQGLKCNCVCPACGATLIAHKGTKIMHHFKHYNAEECQIGYQTSLHLLAKEIISKTKKITIPELTLKFDSCKKPIQISSTKEISIDSVELEKKIGDVIPDIILHSKNKILLVEIFVTHRIGDEKLFKLQKQGVSVIEIDLSKINKMITEDGLKKYLLHDCSEKQWKYNKVLEYWQNHFITVAERYTSRKSTKLIRAFGMYWEGEDFHVYCPLKRKNFSLVEHCHYYCKYCISSNANNEEDCFVNGEYIYPDPVVLCTGKKRISSLNDLKAYIKNNSN